MEKEIKSALIVGILGIIGTVSAAIIGVNTGKNVDQSQVQDESTKQYDKIVIELDKAYKKIESLESELQQVKEKLQQKESVTKISDNTSNENIQPEEQISISLFDEDTYLEHGYLSHGYSIHGNIETTNSFIDNNGNEYFSGVYRWVPNFDFEDTYIECLVDDYSIFSGTIILNHIHKTSKSKENLIIYGDGNVIYLSPDITRGVDPVDFSVDISEISLLRIEFTKEYELLALVNPLLYY